MESNCRISLFWLSFWIFAVVVLLIRKVILILECSSFAFVFLSWLVYSVWYIFLFANYCWCEKQDWHYWDSAWKWILIHMAFLKTGIQIIVTRACGLVSSVWTVECKYCKSLVKYAQIPLLLCFGLACWNDNDKQSTNAELWFFSVCVLRILLNYSSVLYLGTFMDIRWKENSHQNLEISLT